MIILWTTPKKIRISGLKQIKDGLMINPEIMKKIQKRPQAPLEE